MTGSGTKMCKFISKVKVHKQRIMLAKGKDFPREVLVIAQSVCRRRPLFCRDPLPAVERGTLFFLSGAMAQGHSAGTSGSWGEWRIESVHVLPDTRARGGLCLSWCGIRHAKTGTAWPMHSPGNQSHEVCFCEHLSLIIVRVTIFRVS